MASPAFQVGEFGPAALDRILHKTKQCKFYAKGCCEYGERCRFAHGEVEARPTPNLTKTRMCRFLLYSSGCLNDNCQFAHSLDELRHTPEVDSAEDSRPINLDLLESRGQADSQTDRDNFRVFGSGSVQTQQKKDRQGRGEWADVGIVESNRTFSPTTSTIEVDGEDRSQRCFSPPPGLELEVPYHAALQSWEASQRLPQPARHSDFPEMSQELVRDISSQGLTAQTQQNACTQHARTTLQQWLPQPQQQQQQPQEEVQQLQKMQLLRRQQQQVLFNSDSHFDEWKQYHLKNELRRAAALLDKHLAKVEIYTVTSV